MNEAFFKRLYLGYAAEHLVSSQLYRYGYEAFRLPADFGLDLVVTNQFLVAKGNKTASANFPFALQVKSRWLQSTDTIVGPNGRPETKVCFGLKTDEFDLIIKHENSGVVFVAYVPIPDKKGYDFFYLWLHSKQLIQLEKNGFLLSENDRLNLTIRYRRLPHQSREEFVKELEATGILLPVIKEKLLKDLPEIFAKNWAASDYLAFARKSKNGSDDLVFKSVWNVPMAFDTFPEFQEIGGLC